MNVEFERFSTAGMRALLCAQTQARLISLDYVDNESLLLGLIQEQSGLAAKVLTTAGVDLVTARSIVSRASTESTRSIVKADLAGGAVAFSDTCIETLADAIVIAQSMGNRSVGTEHMLLALLQKQDSRLSKLFQQLHVNVAALRQETLRLKQSQ